jgi:hypothetical protein
MFRDQPLTGERSQLFARFEELHPRDLPRPDAERLAQLIQSDPRCCAMLPRSFATRRERAQFRRVLAQAWLNEEYAEVLDYRPRLLQSARQHRRRRAPLIALVLYATWLEHTVNAIIIGAARIDGSFNGHVDDLARRIVDKNFPTRLSGMWTRYKAPPLDRTMKKRMLEFMELRNELIHYKWIGHPPARLETELVHMRTLVGNVRSLVTYLKGIERQITTLKYRPRIRALLELGSARGPARLSSR